MFYELQRQGYRGSYPTVARYTQRLRQAQEGAALQPSARKHPPAAVVDSPKRPLTLRNAAWLVLRRTEDRDAEEAERLNRLRLQPGALADAIAALVRARQPERLEPWLTRAQDRPLPAFRNFAKKLDAGIEAVRAAVRLGATGRWSGQEPALFQDSPITSARAYRRMAEKARSVRSTDFIWGSENARP